MSAIVPNAAFNSLNDSQKQVLRYWRNNVNLKVQPVGLWVAAPRGHGSSYIANVAMRRAMNDHPDWSYEWQPALDLIRAVRNQWTTAEQVRHHPDDYAVWQENALIEGEVEHFWRKADIVCVDDLHSQLDIKFWIKHLQADLELRAKNGLPTIVASNMNPEYREFSEVTRVLENLFVMCDATR